MKKLISISAAVLTFIVLLSAFPTGTESRIYEDTIRLRVIARSNETEDQRVKLLVRDAILRYVEENYLHFSEKEKAVLALDKDRDKLKQIAKETLLKEGYSYDVSVWLGEETYQTRSYESFSLPSGTYTSLQIRLGKAEGDNWWCVLFPPLCLGGALKDEQQKDSIPVGLTSDQYELITTGGKGNGRYRVKFRLLELLSELFDGAGS